MRKGATLGANCTIVCGVEIGAYAFIGAGAVITKPVPAFALMTGVPKRKTMDEHSGHRLDVKYGDSGKASCPQTGQLYQIATTSCQPLQELTIKESK